MAAELSSELNALLYRLTQAGAQIEYLHGQGWHFCLGLGVYDRVPQVHVALLIIGRHIVLHQVRPFPTYVLSTRANGAKKHGPHRVNAVAFQVRAC